ncbi:YadA family autotransporter adhesin [Paraburkholderia sp. HD33-4]|uniref:YadA family autotransporter adhesin n=1 Tax=Paraburkholderia sp. HD33-4 TaxID=2883242 RepID=UPI001F1C3496|nr:YadA-like family protein [Paraburkholderia sp. HD33-4]
MSSLSTSTSTGIASLSTGLGNAVQYDDASHTKVTLGGAGSTTPVTLTNVAAGVNPTDAVNFSQLTSLSTSTSTGISTAQSGVTSLSTALSTTDSNVAVLSTSTSTGISTTQSGVTSLSTALSTTDSNMASLSTGLTNSVQYDDTSHTKVTLGGAGSTTPVTLTNVAAGVNATDAVNFSQLTSLSTSTSTGISTAQSGVTSLSTALSTTDSNVAVLSTSTSTGISTAQSGVTSLSTSLSTTDSNMASLSTGLTNSVQYDDATHTKVTLGGAGSTTPVTLTNVAAGVNPTDAVNFSQLTSLSTSTSTGISTAQSGVTSLSTALSTTDSNVTALSTSTSTGLSSLSTALTATNSSLASLSTGLGDSVQYDDASHTKITLGGAGSTTPVTLTNVANGVNPTDAANFGQLTSLSTSTATGLSTAQSGVTLLSTGLSTTNSNLTQLSTSTSTAISTAQNGVASLSTGLSTTNSNLASLSTGLTTASSSVSALSTGIANGTVGLVQQVGGAPGNGTITVGANTGGTVVDFTGTAGARQLTGVAAGTAPTDAVNVSQLQAVASVANDAVLYDNASHAIVTLGGVGASSAVALTNVAAGAITATSTDAVNGSQLFALQAQITSLGSSSLAGQAPQGAPASSGNAATSKYVAVNSSGSAASATGAESVAIGGNATASSGNSVAVGSGAQASGAGSSAVGANAVAAAPNSVALGAGSVASDANSVSVGSLGHERTIANVAPGVNPTDAVNMQQLNSVQQGVNAVARQAYSGVAGATALTMIPDVDPGKTLAVGIGSGNYKGYTAVAIGFSARVTDNLKVKGGVSTSASGSVVGAGVGYQW